MDWWWNTGGCLVDCWWITGGSGGHVVDCGGLLVDVWWMSGRLLMNYWWIWWTCGGLLVDCWWMSDRLVVDCWWILNYGGCASVRLCCGYDSAKKVVFSHACLHSTILLSRIWEEYGKKYWCISSISWTKYIVPKYGNFGWQRHYILYNIFWSIYAIYTLVFFTIFLPYSCQQ